MILLLTKTKISTSIIIYVIIINTINKITIILHIYAYSYKINPFQYIGTAITKGPVFLLHDQQFL